MALASGDILRVAAKQLWNGIDDHVNVFHLEVVTPPSPNSDAAALQDISELVADAFSNLAGDFCNNLSADVIQVYNITQDRPIGVTSWDAAYTGGTGSADCMPPDDAVLVLLDTGVKRRQGRMNFSAITEANQADGHWLAGVRSNAAVVPGVMLVPFASTNGGVFVLVVWSKTDGVAYPIFTIRAQELVADMPSRKAGRGS